ncbi:LPXTG cell wall anchor domain-containing protein [Micromonospora sp. CPCC 205561]|uniref:LPXTG cell wall anchor domain-containing protein n=1 Tax=Micromonospora sp. CPCC 205561 TaxID=3122407 RepID=UPI002FF2C07D
MTFRNRALAYVGAGAAGILTAGLFAAPALAEDSANLAIEATGTTIAVGAPGKTATVSLLNKSKVDATSVLVGLDISKLDTSKVDIDESGCNPREDGLILCGIKGGVLPAGADIDWGFPLTRKAGTTGDAGQISAIILHEGTDPDESDNEVTVKVKVEGTGPDLTVVASDVDKAVKVEGNKIKVVGDLHAGETAQLIYSTFNQGDAVAAGLKISVKLPKGVTFAEVEQGCEYDSGKTSLVCTYQDADLIPVSQDKDAKDDLISGGRFYHLLSVGKDVRAGSLTGGKVTVEALGTEAKITRAAGRNALPANAEAVAATEVDTTDNTDGYAVVVAAEGGQGGGDGGLPVTGAQTTLIGGIGGVVLVAGAVMFVMARRRRVVLVTPGDEKPTA